MRKLKKILLVDDDQVNNFINENLLKELNITESVTVEINGSNAINYLLDHCENKEKICPELVIFDHYMPVMDGMEMMKALHEIDFIKSKNVIFLLLGIHSIENDIEEFKQLGVQEFTCKPLAKNVVMAACHKYFSAGTADPPTR